MPFVLTELTSPPRSRCGSFSNFALSPLRFDGSINVLNSLDLPVTPGKSARLRGLSPLKRTSALARERSTPCEPGSPASMSLKRSLDLIADTSAFGGRLNGGWSTPCEQRAPAGMSLKHSLSCATDDLIVAGIGCRSPSKGCRSSSKAMLTSKAVGAEPLPKSDVDWLMSTLSEEELTRFHRRYFLSDCERRFRELDADCTGLLGLGNLQYALVDMFPTLKLELRADGRHIPALDKSIPSLISTFDTDSDGYLDIDNFVEFIKFQQAWRAQFFQSTRREHEAQAVGHANAQFILAKSLRSGATSGALRPRRLSKSSSLPQLSSHKSTNQKLLLPPKINNSCTSRPSSTSSTRCSSSCSTRCSSSKSLSRSVDSSCGAFYLAANQEMIRMCHE